ncbi:MAG: hypothetical protein ACRDRZ_05195 [Pseudonocardiaceae bacterium]
MAQQYHDRWQVETGIGEIKTEQRGDPETVLRSKTSTWSNRSSGPCCASTKPSAT